MGMQYEWPFHCFLLSSYGYLEKLVNLHLTMRHMGRNSSVGIATRYGLDGPGIESQWGKGQDFLHPSKPALGPTQPPM